MEHINYLYYNGVLQNLHKHLNNTNVNKNVLNRAIKTIENRLKEYELKPEESKRGRFLQNTFHD